MTPPALPRRLPLLLGTVLVAGLVWSGTATPTNAATIHSLERSIVGMVNRARVVRGLRPLRGDIRLYALAGDRAATLARKGILSHSAAGDLGSQLSGRRVQWYGYGEVLAYASGWGSTTATSLFRLWKGSPAHWKLLMSSRYNYLGVGLAYRSTSRISYASIVLTESRDHTRPWARMDGASRSGTTIRWHWAGKDRRLQTHTAGLRDYDVQYRVNGGTWRTIRNDTTGTSLTLQNRARGNTYAIRVRARDRRGNLSTWSREVRVSLR
jgi:uncharacterized protein YkwD